MTSIAMLARDDTAAISLTGQPTHRSDEEEPDCDKVPHML
jgi:hypothetical protein